MRTILFIIQKEFIQIFRNRMMLPVIFVVPIIQLVILVNAATMEMKHIEMYVIDNDLSSISRELVSKFEGSPFYFIKSGSFALNEAENELKRDEVDVILQIPHGFEQKLYRDNHADVQLLISAINGAAAGIIFAYSNSIISDFNSSLLTGSISSSASDMPVTISLTRSFWYNPDLNYKVYMLPGILVILVTIIGMFLSSLNLVREKEMGTIEQINVTPIRKYQFIIGKLLPFWIIALFELAFGLAVGKILFNIPILGNLLLLFGFASLYLLAIMGIGLFISTVSSTQQQVMFLSFFFMITFILMSGIFTPSESMPQWAQQVNIINPFAYFMRVIRMVMLKGSGFQDISKEFFSLGVYAVVMLSLAVWRYKKVA
ncbi:MAG: ABC transporter permease [Bacteroidetes bacterium]|nr:ABC transporter permease [Bacteroidota bacterium]